MQYRGYRDLEIYKLSYQLALEIFEITKKFPKECCLLLSAYFYKHVLYGMVDKANKFCK